jgi:hypothetical protein
MAQIIKEFWVGEKITLIVYWLLMDWIMLGGLKCTQLKI